VTGARKAIVFLALAMMTLLTILLSPLIGYVRLRAESVFAAAVFHGTFNAAATLVLFLSGGNVLITGMTGATGMVTLLLANGVLWLHLRRTSGLMAAGAPVAGAPG